MKTVFARSLFLTLAVLAVLMISALSVGNAYATPSYRDMSSTKRPIPTCGPFFGPIQPARPHCLPNYTTATATISSIPFGTPKRLPNYNPFRDRKHR